ncbi:MAG: hypothetical protein IKH12_08090, partial [Clostridia bacterium]|nr:hypothetical protein [Clostridia bacterium]
NHLKQGLLKGEKIDGNWSFSEEELTEYLADEAVKQAAQTQPQGDTPPASRAYCPYCGAKTAPDHSFCQSCGKRLP